MTATQYSLLAALIFALVAVLQFVRAIAGLQLPSRGLRSQYGQVGLPAVSQLSSHGLGNVPVIGFLGPGSAQSDAYRVIAFWRGLSEAGLVEGRDFTIECRWAEGHYDRLPALATELIDRRVTLIATSSLPASLAAKAVS